METVATEKYETRVDERVVKSQKTTTRDAYDEKLSSSSYDHETGQVHIEDEEDSPIEEVRIIVPK